MGLLNFGRLPGTGETRSVTAAGSSGWDTLAEYAGNQYKTHSGQIVQDETALTYSVVWAATRLIVESISTLPPKAVSEAPDGSIQPTTLPAWVRSPHPNMRRADVLSQFLTSVILWGNGYARIVRDGRGGISALVPVSPGRVNVQWVDPIARTERYYQIDGGQWLYDKDVMHVQGPTVPGQAFGLGVISQAREAIGLGLSLEEFGARYFGQGSLAKVVLRVPGAKPLAPEDAKNLVAGYERFHKGSANWHRPAVASGGVEIEQISIPPNDAQFLQSREFQAVDIARWFGVPPHAIGIISKETSWGSGLAQQNTAMLQRTFRPWIQRLEAAFTYYTAGGEDLGTLIRFDDSALQRGSFDEQAKTFTDLADGGVLTRNEARKALGFGKVAGGDELLVPTTTMLASAAKAGVAAQQAATEAAKNPPQPVQDPHQDPNAPDPTNDKAPPADDAQSGSQTDAKTKKPAPTKQGGGPTTQKAKKA